MENNKKELLERVLLLMNYNNKETLSENISKVKVLTEQPDPNKKLHLVRICTKKQRKCG